ncbi:MAG: amidohydrolase [Planctomyces sp.]|nr:amidohydrolase [Planctomyces sp.]
MTDSPESASEKSPALVSGGINFPIVDTHQHLWDLQRFELPWLNADREYPPGEHPLGRSHLPHDYLTAAHGLGIVKTIYMEVDVAVDQQADEMEYVTALCEDPGNPMAGAVVSSRPGEAGFGDWVRKLARNRWIKGVRRVLHANDTPPGLCKSQAFIRSLQELGEYGLSFDFCIRPTELLDAAEVAKACPETRFILDHCGNLPVHGASDELRQTWQEGMLALAECENVVCKISGIVASARDENWNLDDLRPVVDGTLDAFGPDRVMFASDWPVCTLRSSLSRWVDALRTIVENRPLLEQRRLFHDNAVRFYGLES